MIESESLRKQYRTLNRQPFKERERRGGGKAYRAGAKGRLILEKPLSHRSRSQVLRHPLSHTLGELRASVTRLQAETWSTETL